MKIKRISIILFLILASVFTFGACTPGERTISDGKTINVKVFKAGYGVNYIYSLKEKFENIYSEEGYKVNILTPQRDIQGATVLQEIYADGGIDLYFTSNIILKQALGGDYGKTVAELTDIVYDKKPISFDGTEESVNVSEKLRSGSSYDIYDSGKTYGMPWVEGTGGMVYNKRVLSSYGLEEPKTTSELFDCYMTIMKTAAQTGVYPYTYISGENNYPAHLTNLWMAQYSGSDFYESFWSMADGEGVNMRDNGYALFADESIKEMLTCMYEAFDFQSAAYGSATQDISSAQAQIMRGTAVFMSAGDYFFNEESLSFESKLGDISYMNVPVISALGFKLFGAGTSYGLNDARCEELLSFIVGEADKNKTVAEIGDSVSSEFSIDLAASDIEEVANARGYVYNRTYSHIAYISEKSEVKDIAALFLRMCASDDGAALMAEKTMASNPFYAGDVHSGSKYVFLKSASAVLRNRYSKVLDAEAKGFRSQLKLNAIFPYTGIFVQNSIISQKVTIYNNSGTVVNDRSVYRTSAGTLATAIANNASSNWPNWVGAL